MRCLQIWVHAWIRWSGFTNKPEFNWRSVADSVVQFLGCEGQIYVSSRKSWFYRFMKRKTVQTKYDVPVRRAFRWDSKNFVKQSFTKFLESQLHGSRRKSYLSAPFFFHLRYEWLVRGRLYMPNLHCESHHRICQFTLWNSRLWDECLLYAGLEIWSVLNENLHSE